MRAHGCGERGCPSAAPCSEALEHLTLDDHLLAAELEEVILVLAQLFEPLAEGCHGIDRRQQRIEPRQRPIRGCQPTEKTAILKRTFNQ